MKAPILLLLTLAIALVFAQEGDVLVLDSENFQKTIDENPLIAVEFYAPWCGHCKSLAPEWESAATTLKGKVPIAKVDCTQEEKLCEKYGVSGFPTLTLFRNGEQTPLEVARKAEPIVAYLTAELAPALTILKTEADIDTFKAEHPFAVIGYFDNDHDDRFNDFNKLASKLKHTSSFGAVHDVEVSADKARPTVELHRTFDEPSVVYGGEFTFENIGDWVAREKLPILGEINAETYSGYVSTGLPIGYVFVDPTADNTATFESIKAIAKTIKDKAVLAWIDNNKFAQHGVRMGLTGKVVPSFVIDDAKKGSRFKFAEENPITELGKWIESWVKNEIAPHVKSEDVPADNSGPVKTVVAHTFESIVKDTTKDVLVEFYAPWCGHCKKLVPVWDELGEEFKNSPKVVIAKIDATANDVPPELNIRGFPTILLFTAGDKQTPVEYQGSRELEDLKRFVRQHSEGAEEETEEENVHDEL